MQFLALICILALLVGLSYKFGPKRFSLQDCLTTIEKEDLQFKYKKFDAKYLENKYVSIIYEGTDRNCKTYENVSINLARTLGAGCSGCVYIFWEDGRVVEWRHNSQTLRPMNLKQQDWASQILTIIQKRAAISPLL